MPRRGQFSDPAKKVNLEHLEHHAANGLTKKAIAPELGISERSLHKYIKRSLQVRAAYDRGRAQALAVYERNLHQLAAGYKFVERKTIETSIFDEQGRETGQIARRTIRVERQMAPDLDAIKFALMNRAPDEWKNVNKIDLLPVDEPGTPDKLERWTYTDDEYKEIAAIMVAVGVFPVAARDAIIDATANAVDTAQAISETGGVSQPPAP